MEYRIQTISGKFGIEVTGTEILKDGNQLTVCLHCYDADFINDKIIDELREAKFRALSRQSKDLNNGN